MIQDTLFSLDVLLAFMFISLTSIDIVILQICQPKSELAEFGEMVYIRIILGNHFYSHFLISSVIDESKL